METTTQKTLTELVAESGVTLIAERTDHNPNMQDSRDMDHWKVKLVRRESVGKRYNARKDGTAVVARMSLYFSMGYGHNGAEPDLAGVLDCLLSDASANDTDFVDWCSELGYEEDSRKAERTYKACVKSGAKLRAFLGADLFEQMRYAER